MSLDPVKLFILTQSIFIEMTKKKKLEYLYSKETAYHNWSYASRGSLRPAQGWLITQIINLIYENLGKIYPQKMTNKKSN